ncbi:GroES-like protein [Nemania sp. FL0916]|nr:GroES-like protein [Nemania sp. FL0916]
MSKGGQPQNEAAWLTAKQAKPLHVGPAPYTTPGPGQIVVKNAAVAINPVDWQKQILGDILLGYIKYPFVLGGDVAGIVAEIGPGVQRFKVSDRVVAAALALAPASANAAEAAFQRYTLVREHMAAPLPDHISYEQACVIPLTLSTAVYGLFHPSFLGLDMPAVPPTTRTPASRIVIITGGSSSVGANAIQLAVAAGYEVLSTSSPKNFDFVKKLGASHVFDYNSKTLATELLGALKGRTLAGAYAIGDGAVEVCTLVMTRHKDTTHKFVAMAGGSPLGDQLQTLTGKVLLIITILWKILRQAVTARFTGVKVQFIDLKDAAEPDGHVARIYKDYLPRALVEGQHVPAPDPVVVGSGVGKIQEAMDIQMKGVSAQKIVVSL